MLAMTEDPEIILYNRVAVVSCAWLGECEYKYGLCHCGRKLDPSLHLLFPDGSEGSNVYSDIDYIDMNFIFFTNWK